MPTTGTASLVKEVADGCVRLLVMSDTHNRHDSLLSEAHEWPSSVDMVIHCGDFSMSGKAKEVRDFDEFGRKLAEMGCAKHLVCIAGNHERSFEFAHFRKHYSRSEVDPASMKRILVESEHWLYLEDEAATLCGLHLYGSPWQPAFCDWAFNLRRGSPALASKWDAIPADTDVLITHGPPFGHGDVVCAAHFGLGGGCATPHVGDRLLLDVVTSEKHRAALKYHLFGHIHEAYGATARSSSDDGGSSLLLPVMVNASSVNVRYRRINRPFLLDVPL